jgi:micrococcal nuclease
LGVNRLVILARVTSATMTRNRSNHRRGWHGANDGKFGRGRKRARGMRFSWGELRLVVLGGILAGLSVAAMPDDWLNGRAFAEGAAEIGLVVPGAAPETEARAGAGAGDVAHARFDRCSGPVRVNCVVDGDTFWMDGEKIRIADLNAPEVSSPKCASEARLGARATDALIVQLNAGPFALEAIDRDEDRYGRKLRRVTRGGESVGEAMVSAGVARWYGEGRRGWC